MDDDLVQVASEVVSPKVVEVCEEIDDQNADTKCSKEKEFTPILDFVFSLDTSYC